jgi:hypothetical protein
MDVQSGNCASYVYFSWGKFTMLRSLFVVKYVRATYLVLNKPGGDLPLLHRVQTDSEAHPPFCPVGIGGSFLVGKAVGACN